MGNGSAFSRATRLAGAVPIALPSGKTIEIVSFVLQLPEPAHSKSQLLGLSETYRSKRLVEFDAESLFGELAIVRLLEQDGWGAVWADTFHGKFWSDMPHKSSPVMLPATIKPLYDRIASVKAGPAGCFDVIAWKRAYTIFIEYKSLRDRPNKNESLWIDAALTVGVSPADLFFVGQRSRSGA